MGTNSTPKAGARDPTKMIRSLRNQSSKPRMQISEAVTDEKRKTVVPPITLEGIERKVAAIFPRSPQAMREQHVTPDK